MRYKIDLHNHTDQSDGIYPLRKVVQHRTYLDFLCITDHYPGYPDSYRENTEILQQYPGMKQPAVFIGIELYLLLERAEVLVFGAEAIGEILKQEPADASELGLILENHAAAVIICHPYNKRIFENENLLKIADGIEITLRGQYLAENDSSYQELFNKVHAEYGLNLFATSDFHGPYDFGFGGRNLPDTHTIIDCEPILSEEDLVARLKQQLSTIPVYKAL